MPRPTGVSMTGKKVVWTIIAVAAALVIGLLLLLRAHRLRVIAERLSVPIEGAVIQRDADTNKAAAHRRCGDHRIRWREQRRDPVRRFGIFQARAAQEGIVRAAHYRHLPPSALRAAGNHRANGKVADSQPALCCGHGSPCSPRVQKTAAGSSRPATLVSDIRVRYTINSRSETNVGSAVRTFQVVNKGNVPCDHHSPCSPDGKWKATSATVSLDAGADNTFGNITASCIAGPCPFTRIDSSGFIHGGRNISCHCPELVRYGYLPHGG